MNIYRLLSAGTFALAALVFTPAAAQARGWRAYENPAWGYRLQYPDYLFSLFAETNLNIVADGMLQIVAAFVGDPSEAQLEEAKLGGDLRPAETRRPKRKPPQRGAEAALGSGTGLDGGRFSRSYVLITALPTIGSGLWNSTANPMAFARRASMSLSSLRERAAAGCC